MAIFLIHVSPATCTEADFPDLPALLAVFPRPWAVDVWNGKERRWEMLDELIEDYRRIRR